MTTPDSYEIVLDLLRQSLPGVAAEIEQEVRRGRVATKTDFLRDAQYQERVSTLADERLPAIDHRDIGVIPYSEDEQLDLIRQALATLAETMASTRRALLDLSSSYDVDHVIEFGDPELEVLADLDLETETAAAEAAARAVRSLLHRETDGGMR